MLSPPSPFTSKAATTVPYFFTVVAHVDSSSHRSLSTACRSLKSSTVRSNSSATSRRPTITGVPPHRSRFTTMTSFSVRSRASASLFPFSYSGVLLTWYWLCRSTSEPPRPHRQLSLPCHLQFAGEPPPSTVPAARYEWVTITLLGGCAAGRGSLQ
jgi:hypothetical protein